MCGMHVAKPLRQESERLQEQQIITLLGVYKTTKWCNSFVIVHRLKGMVHLCLNPAQLNKALTRPIHRGPTINNIFPTLSNQHYLTLIDASSGYHILNLNRKSSYLITFGSQFGRYRLISLPFGVVPLVDMF